MSDFSRACRRLLGPTVVIATLLPAWGARAAPPPPPPPPPGGPVIACQNSVCIIHTSDGDTDDDGFSDEDEIVAGTDPFDAKSHPRVLDLVVLWRGGAVGVNPEHPFREVFVLPETAPDGTAIGRSPIPELPGRKDALSALGITDEHLKGIDLTNGLRVTLDVRPHETSSDGKEAPPPMRVGGIDVRLISGETYMVVHSEEGGEVAEYFDKETGEKVGQDSTVHHPNGCTTYQTCGKEHGCITTVECPPNTSMSDPDADTGVPQPGWGTVHVATPEQIAEYNLKRGMNTTFGSTGVDTSGPPPSRDKSPIILINPDDDSVWVSTQTTAGVPTNFNRFGGNVNGGRPDGPPRPEPGGTPKP